MKQWGDMSQIVIGNGRARLPKSLDDSGNLERVPYQDGFLRILATFSTAARVRSIPSISKNRLSTVNCRTAVCHLASGTATRFVTEIARWLIE